MSAKPRKALSGAPTTGDGLQSTDYVDNNGNTWVRLAGGAAGDAGAPMSRSATSPGTTVTIANAGTTSGAVDIRTGALIGIIIPAAFTGTSISFLVSDTLAGTYQPLYDETGTQSSVPVVQGRSYAAPASLSPWGFVEIVSNAAEGGQRSIVVVTKS